MANVAFDRTVSTRWLYEMYALADDGWVSLFSLDRTTGERHVDWAHTDDLNDLSATAEARSDTCCVWFGVATRTHRIEGGGRGGADDCKQITALWVDIDWAGPNHADNGRLPPDEDAARTLLRSYPHKPSAVVWSGGGLQPWWFLQEPLDAGDAARVLADWGHTWHELGARHGWHVDNVFDVARIMRLPGTINHKREPTLVEMQARWERRYGVDDLWFDDPPAERPAPTQRIPYIGPERPGDAFNAHHDGGQLLETLGCQLARSDRSGDRHYVRPGKEARDGTSATVYADGHTTIWSETLAAHSGLEVRRPYDPFGLYVATRHGGDWQAATQDLASRGYGAPRVDPTDVSWVTDQLSDPDGDRPRWALPRPDIDTFLNEPEPDYDWAIPKILERGDRVILTGPEGGGKSTLIQQVAVQAAAGIHPFTLDTMTPLRVVLLDLENGRRHIRRQLRRLRDTVGHRLNPEQLTVSVVPSGIDLMHDEGLAALHDLLADTDPDLVACGPLYKFASGDPKDEEQARRVAYTLDGHREAHNCAFLIEAHQPYPQGGTRRPERPYGASLWSRWPEFGLHITKDGELRHWRGDRDERDWPKALRRDGSEWPWEPTSDTAWATFAMILGATRTEGRRLSTRELEAATGIPRSTVARMIDANKKQYDAVIEEVEAGA